MAYPSKIDPAALPAVALSVAEAQGWDDWSLRDVAAELGVSPNALYRYVADRDELVVDMGVVAVQELTAALTQPDGDDPMATLLALAEAYVDFAASRPGAYQAVIRAKPAEGDPRRDAWHRCVMLLVEVVAGVVPDTAEACAMACWSTLHGRVDLSTGPAAALDPKDGLEETIRALVRGYANG